MSRQPLMVLAFLGALGAIAWGISHYRTEEQSYYRIDAAVMRIVPRENATMKCSPSFRTGADLIATDGAGVERYCIYLEQPQ